MDPFKEENLQKGSVLVTCFLTPEMVENGNINMYPFAVYNLKIHCMCNFNAMLYLSFCLLPCHGSNWS